MMPMLHQAEAVLDTELPADPKAKMAVARGKLAARPVIDAFRELLFPEDDDG